MFFLRKRASILDGVFFAVISLVSVSVFVLNSISPNLFPQYYIFLTVSLLFYIFLRSLDFEIFSAFSMPLYAVSIILLIATLVIGSVTRGTVRWIPIGSLAFQPSEVVRPFLFLYFANLLHNGKEDLVSTLKLLGVSALPLILIFIQPSFGVTLITLTGFVGMILAKGLNKKVIATFSLLVLIFAGMAFSVLKPYQKDRILSFLNPSLDPAGAGYNSIQSVIAVGAGGIFGRGLGEGVQTQLKFLPEKQTDFIFAATGEELGFVGSIFVVFLTFYILYQLLKRSENTSSKVKYYFIIACFFTYFSQVFVHIGMNLGVLPITGVPFPLLSAGGSSLLGTVMMLGIAFAL